MLRYGLNHMTAPTLGTPALFKLAQGLGCIGVELRNDLGRPLFDGADPGAVRALAADAGLRILALAEVKAFNDPTRTDYEDAAALADVARTAGAQGIALIPQVGDAPVPRADQRAALAQALRALRPILEQAGITGLIEPLGFEQSTLRFKTDVADALAAMGTPACFAIVHDTFHHHLAGEDDLHADLTGIVHISGVVDPGPTRAQMRDAHRVLIDADDRLGNIAQLRALMRAGYTGPASFEAFAPAIHGLSDPAPALAASKDFIASRLQEIPA